MEAILQIAPLIIGYVFKFMAIKRANNANEYEYLIKANSANNKTATDAFNRANTESKASAANRRVVLWAVILLVSFYVVAGIWFPTVIEVTVPGLSFLGIEIIADYKEFQTVHGVVKYDEVFDWGSSIVEMYFGAYLAKK